MPFIVISSIIGALIINHLNSGELSFPSEAETSKIEATTDHLTGLVNRRGLDTIFPNLSGASSGNKGRGMLYFDIDRFKLANDSHGHAFGDEVLKQVAERVAGNLRQNDIFARVGGDTSSSLSCQKSAKKRPSTLLIGAAVSLSEICSRLMENLYLSRSVWARIGFTNRLT